MTPVSFSAENWILLFPFNICVDFPYDILQAKIFLFILILVMGLAFPFSLIFEVPFVNLDKIYLSPLSIKQHRLEQSNNSNGSESTDPTPSSTRSLQGQSNSNTAQA